MVVFVVKRYAVCESKKWRYAVRNAKIEQYAVRKGGGGCHPLETRIKDTGGEMKWVDVCCVYLQQRPTYKKHIHQDVFLVKMPLGHNALCRKLIEYRKLYCETLRQKLYSYVSLNRY